MGLTPISDFLVVRIEEPAATPQADGGSLIVRPFASATPQPLQGVVLAAGPGRIESGVLQPLPCAVGDRVLLQFNAGSEVILDGETVRIVPAKDLFGVLG